MCYGTCHLENFNGECRRKPSDGPCPATFETMEDYHNYMKEVKDAYYGEDFEALEDGSA